jgi:hypothetical protein
LNNLKTHQFKWDIWIQWVLATSVGLVVSDGLSVYISLGECVDLFIPGAIIGTLQWLFILQFQISRATRWIWSTFLGWTIGWVLGMLAGSIVSLIIILATSGLEPNSIINAGSNLAGMTVLLVVHGVILGTTQWLFALKSQYHKAIWWIPANIIGWPLANGLSWGILGPLFLSSVPFSGLIDSAIRGVVFGAITGGMLVWLLQEPRHETRTEKAEEILD